MSAHRDRSRRLALFGSLAVLVGAASMLLALSHLLLPLLPASVIGESPAGGLRAALMGFLLFTVVGVVLAWVGVGSLRLRRWVQPTMLVIAWSWLIAGALGLLLVYGMLDDLVILATAEMPDLPPEIVTAVRVVVLGLAVLFGLILPGAFVLAYRDDDVRKTCEAHDDAPSWTDRRPLPVLGLSVGLVLAAVLFLPTALMPVVPVFGALWTGWRGALAIVLFSALTAWMGRECFRLRWRGWWGTTILLLAAGASVVLTFLRIAPVELYRAMGYPEGYLAPLEHDGGTGRPWIVSGTVVLTALSTAYMLAIRKHFVARGDARRP